MSAYFQENKKLKNLLETALNELTTEQNKRKESEHKLLELELEIVNKNHQIKTLELEMNNIIKEKDEKISRLESSINYLHNSIFEKEQEIFRLEELTGFAEEKPLVNKSPSQTVEKFQQTLNKLLENSKDSKSGLDLSHPDQQDTFIDEEAELVMNVDETEDSPAADGGDGDEEEEYILDESLEELQNEDNNVVEITEAVDIKEDFILPPKVTTSSRSRVKTSDGSGKDCPVCGEMFPTKSLLKEHQKESDHMPRYECDVCLKTFKTKGTCQQHKARIHSNVMPFKCNICDKRFKDIGSCRRHEANVSVHIRYSKSFLWQ